MGSIRRYLLIVSSFMLMLASSSGWVSAAGTPEASLSANEGTCPPSSVVLAGEALPENVFRESLSSSEITGSDLRSVTSVICIAAGTEITVPMNPPDLGDTTEISQHRVTTIVVLTGVLRVQIVKLCASATAGGACASAGGSASYFSGAAPYSRTEFGTDWVELHPGDVAVLNEVTVKYATTADSYARFMTLGTFEASGDGSGCAASCWQMP